MRGGASHFTKEYRAKRHAYVDFERPSIESTLEALGMTDFHIHEASGSRPEYWAGPCPFHNWEKNDKTFIVWPAIQRCACLSCSPTPFDAIDLWMRARGVDFKTAKEQICVPVPQEVALLKQLQVSRTETADLLFYAQRINSLFSRLDFGPARQALFYVNTAISAGQYSAADRILRRAGV